MGRASWYEDPRESSASSRSADRLTAFIEAANTMPPSGALGLAAFSVGPASGVLLGKLLYLISGGKVNPMIGAAGVSAVPMAARVVQRMGQRENPNNFLLMNAIGPNYAGVIGSAVAAGVLMAMA